LYSSLVAVTDILEKIHKCNEKACERGSLTLKRRIGDESTFENDRVEVGRRLKEAIGEHQTIMHDIRPLLKSLASVSELILD
uniref:DUF632 domain-containing protein n=1 Tax=Anisakis simplex TaxID=6269 RepID=A0A0M3JHU9_ANISI